MLSDEALADLAEDIRANGQRVPILLDQEGRLLDGRNRLRACGMAGVAPRFARLNGHDALAFILSANVERRRSLTAGQKAIVAALIYPEAFERRRGKKGSKLEPLPRSRLSEARAIVRWSHARALEVLSGVAAFHQALAEANDATASR
jgi:hypothetical protein